MSYPVSYYSGPLKTSNILPKDPTGFLTGIWYASYGVTALGNRTAIQKRMTDCNRKFDFIGVHGLTSVDGGSLGTGGEQWVHSLGAFPFVSWSPNATLGQINSGQFDQVFRNAATYYKNLGFRILLRMMWEFNGNWYYWAVPAGPKNGNHTFTGNDYISAWRRIVNIFKAMGASNVGFAWSPSEWQSRSVRDSSYPGDAYVDWVTPDGYNHDGGRSGNVWSTSLHGYWAEFNEIFNVGTLSTYAVYSNRKPFGIAETGTKYDTANRPPGHVVDVNRKANWYPNIGRVAKPKMPNFYLLELFDQYLQTEGNDWHVDSNQPAGTATPGTTDVVTYQGFKDLMSLPQAKVGYV